jgi:hypothetical protein
VDVPDVYNDIYSKSNPYNEKVELKSLQVLLQLAGLSVLAQRKVSLLDEACADIILKNTQPTLLL